jgi:CRISPR system Cascade subunit CasC
MLGNTGNNNIVLDIHILQSLPPSCLNRDDTGAPKTATYGGVRRARVSSQAWKRATRRYFNEYLDQNNKDNQNKAYRTRKLESTLFDRAKDKLGSCDEIDERKLIRCVKEASAKLIGKDAAKPSSNSKSNADGKDAKKTSDSSDSENSSLQLLGYTLFISESTIQKATEAIVKAYNDEAIDATELSNLMGEKPHTLDIALFGRMVADASNLNVDAACQVAHAISTHRVATEFDYYTTVDDLNNEYELGAAMLGDIEFYSATLYRYAAVSINGLKNNLGGLDGVSESIRLFVEGFIRSLPTGHQTTFAANTLPELVLLTLRNDQPISFAGAFERPVYSNNGGYALESAKRLVDFSTDIEKMYNSIPLYKGILCSQDVEKEIKAKLNDSIRRSSTLSELLNNLHTKLTNQLDLPSEEQVRK